VVQQKSVKFIFPFVAYVGTVFGVGLYSLPYVMSRSGVWVFLLFMLIVSGLVFLVNFLFADIVLRTPSKERFLGYVGQYVGKRAEKVFGWITVVGFWGTFLAYLLVWGEFAYLAFGSVLPFSAIQFSLFFFVITAVIIIKGGRTIEWIDVVMLIGAAFLFGTLFVKGYAHVTEFIASPASFEGYILPYGSLMFAFWVAGIIPEIVNQMRESPKKIIQLLVAGKALVAVLGFLFALFIVGITGAETSREAFAGLESIVGRTSVLLGAIIGMITITLAYNNLGWVSRNILMYDVKIKKIAATASVVVPPLLLMLAGLVNFVLVISIIGAIFLASQGFMIFQLYRRSHTIKENTQPSLTKKPVPTWLLTTASIVFSLGILVEVSFVVYEFATGRL